jgi:hypothetical protein
VILPALEMSIRPELFDRRMETEVKEKRVCPANERKSAPCTTHAAQLTSGVGSVLELPELAARSRCAQSMPLEAGSAGQQASCYHEAVCIEARKAISWRCTPGLGLGRRSRLSGPASSPSPSSALARQMY